MRTTPTTRRSSSRSADRKRVTTPRSVRKGDALSHPFDLRARWDAPDEMSSADQCPSCGSTTTRPDIVWFGEMPQYLDEIARHLASADLFAAIGTSGQVYPAAGFVSEAKRHGVHTVEINLLASDISNLFDEHIVGPATEVVPRWVDGLLPG